MRVQLFLVVLILCNTLASSEVAHNGLIQMHDFLSGFGGSASNGLSSLGSQFGSGFGSLGNIASSGLGSFIPILNQLISAWGSLLSQGVSGGGTVANTLFSLLKNTVDLFFKMFGSFSTPVQGQISGLYTSTGNVFVSVMKLKLNPDHNQDKLKKEVAAAQKIMETKHANSNELIKSLQKQAPQITAATKLAFAKAKIEYNKQFSKLHPEAKKGTQKLTMHLQQSKLDIMSILGTMTGMISPIMSIISSLMSNVMSMLG